MKTGVELINKERQRQIEKEGWTPEHDDQHQKGELAVAAACYAGLSDGVYGPRENVNETKAPFSWPWSKKWWKPSDSKLKNLAKAGALIAAEIDRLQRIEK